MLGLALVHALSGSYPAPAPGGYPAPAPGGYPAPAAPAPVEDGVHRGTGWYSTTPVPEPPIALALVIVGVAGVRAQERRMRRRLAALGR